MTSEEREQMNKLCRQIAVEKDYLRGHIKSGQRWSLQNRPTEVAED